MRKVNLLLSIAAGLLGGICSHFFLAPPVHAQSEAPLSKEVRAQSFVLVNDKGVVLGTFCSGSKDRPIIRLFDADGREIWSAGGLSIARPYTGK